MSDEYTPTTEQVRRDYAYVLFEFGPTPRKLAEFDRWLARFRAGAQVEALREAADPFQNVTGSDTPIFSPATADYLHDRADRIAREAGIDSKGENNE